jgi:NAD-dependent aldehyde dehydrogenases
MTSGQNLPDTGYFIAPTIVTNVSPDSRLVQEEQFGPVLPLIRYHDIEEVLTKLTIQILVRWLDLVIRSRAGTTVCTATELWYGVDQYAW